MTNTTRQTRLSVTDPARRLSIAQLNEIQARRRQERVEVVAALKAGYIGFATVLATACAGDNLLTKTSIHTILTWTGMTSIAAARTMRWVADHAGMGATVDPKKLPLRWLVDQRARHRRMIIMADALCRYRRKAPVEHYPFQFLVGGGGQ